MNFQTLLNTATPPVVGAVIGYVTNDIAIRMLFRPLKPWHILGMRVPLTPGVIPAGRHEFATSIGRMVGTHLVTGDDVAQALGKDAFRRELRETVNNKLDRLLDREFGPVSSLVPPGLEQWLADLGELVTRQVTDEIVAYLGSDGLRSELAGYLAVLENRVLPREVARFLEGDRYDEVRQSAGRALAALLQSRGVTRAVAGLVDEKLETLLADERSLRELLPAELVELVAGQLDEAVAPMLARLGELLRTPEFRAGLDEKLKAGIGGALQNLKGALGFMAGLISVDKIYAMFPGLIDKVAAEIELWLREERTRCQVAGVVRQSLDEFLDRPLAASLARVPYRRVAAVRKMLRKGALGLVRTPGTAELLLELAERELQRRLLAGGEGEPLLDRLVPAAEADRLRGALADGVATLLRAPETRSVVARLVETKLGDWLYRTPLGRLSARLPAGARRDLDEAVYRQVAELLEKEVPPLIEAIDVSRMVEEKINTLDILKVEGLLLSIMEKHFLYINLFGALLGFVMGCGNVLLLALSR